MEIAILVLGIFAVFVGPFLASYFSVVVFRDEYGGVINSDRRSQCLNCHRTLSWYELIPILNFLWLRGKCASCGEQIDRRNLISEIVGLAVMLPTGLSSLQLYFSGDELTTQSVWNQLVLIVMAAILLYFSIYDLYNFAVPFPLVSWVLAGGLVLVATFNLLNWLKIEWMQQVDVAQPDHILTSVLVALLFGGIVLLTRQQGMGEGDIWIAAIVGLTLGWERGWMAIFLTLVCGGLIGVIMLVSGKAQRKTVLPFIPFLAVGFALSVWIGLDLYRTLFPIELYELLLY